MDSIVFVAGLQQRVLFRESQTTNLAMCGFNRSCSQSRTGAFLEGHPERSAHSLDELEDGRRLVSMTESITMPRESITATETVA
jgi:hypothetical protein